MHQTDGRKDGQTGRQQRPRLRIASHGKNVCYGGVVVCVLHLQLFVAMSVLGTVFRGYFFAFHLLNIVNNNQLLKGVIQAVTQNGRRRRFYPLSYCCYFFSVVIISMVIGMVRIVV